MLLDGHFQIEHTARHRSGCFFNFNGTAGIWREDVIKAAGGWRGDTLTEDLDLSYRAQLLGAKFVYLVDESVPSELPMELDAFKCQQHRWTAGAIQVMRKLWRRILFAPLPLKVKYEAICHLGANLCYPMLLVAGLLLLPLAEILHNARTGEPGFFWLKLVDVFFTVGILSVLIFYVIAYRESRNTSWLTAMCEVPIALMVGVGLCLSNSLAALEGVELHGKSAGDT